MAAEQPAEPAAGEPKTETTLTTRIRINIPGSRPIPPVVVRTTVDEGAAASAAAEAAEQDTANAAAAAAAADAEPGPEKTSDWFAPRKPVANPPAAAPPAAPSPGPAGRGSAAGPGGPGAGPGPAQGPGPGFGGRSGELGGNGANGGNVPFPGPQTPYGAGSGADAFPGPVPTGPPLTGPYGELPSADPYADYDTGSHPAPPGDPNAPAGNGFFRPQVPDSGVRGGHDTPPGGFESPFAGGTEGFPPGVPRPSDPYTGEDPGARPYDTAGTFAPPGAGNPANPLNPAGGPAGPLTDEPFPGYQPPAGPTTGPVTGSMPVPPVGPSGLRPPVRPTPVPPPDDRLGDTLVSGIPVVPSSPGAPRPAAPGPRSVPVPEPVPVPAPVPAPAAASNATTGPAAAASSAAPKPPAAARPKKKPRSKVVLLGVAVGGVLVLAYGAGLLMNHADVPKGTTVLGVDIGNESTDQAGKSLNQALGDRTTAPLILTIGGKKTTLKPSVAGLSFDADATVRAVAHSDYNPESVIRSLFGSTRPATPVILVDEDKLKAALKVVAGKNSTATDGMIRFEPNKIVPVAGKAGTSFDVDAAANQVAAAYHVRAETGANTPIDLAVTTLQPKVTQAELDKAVNGFAEHAMSHTVLVRADAAHEILFGPTVSLPKVLTMLPDDAGHLQPHIDLTALKTLYGGTFNGVLVKRPDGSKTAVTPQDVAGALLSGLDVTSTSQKTVTLPGVVG
ncbi:hypothetical protein ACFO3J_14220 [Streptomyces polygonati]|uniref:Peptidoglycan binding domain-containing protein n=1 Tax=Streptomyces polygonati TaxID=1617087 RepID=A0ABV8HPC3_9ACTN